MKGGKMKTSLIKKVSNSFVGRVIRRLAGEERGVVMMEYIVVGLLIAAAVVVAVAVFGRTANDMFGSLSTTMTGDYAQGRAQQNQTQANTAAGATSASAHNVDVSTNKGTTDVGAPAWTDPAGGTP